MHVTELDKNVLDGGSEVSQTLSSVLASRTH